MLSVDTCHLRLNCPSALTGTHHVLLGINMLLEDPHSGKDVGLPQRRDESNNEDEPGDAAHDVVPTLGECHVESHFDRVEFGGVGHEFLAGCRRTLLMNEAPDGESTRFVLICCLRPLKII